VGEHHLQCRPDADQQVRRGAHELQEQAERDHHAQPRAWEQGQIRTDQGRHRAAGADDDLVQAAHGVDRDQVRHCAADQEQQQQPPRPQHPLGGQAEDQQEHQVAQQM